MPSPHFLKDVPLSPYSTMAIGGKADLLAIIETIEEMAKAIRWCHRQAIPFLAIGRGSNCLFDDQGYRGAVLINRIGYLHSQQSHWKVGAGFSFARLGQITAREGWSGLEFAAGIPGSVGGAIAMNGGAQGRETCDALETVLSINSYGELEEWRREELLFGYRSSPFQNSQWGTIVGATFLLEPSIDALQRQREMMATRYASQPYEKPSAGCVFRNPTQQSAGALLDRLGCKGMRCGGAIVSPKHANFIINEGGATCNDVLELIERLQQKLLSENRQRLELEIHYIPSDKGLGLR